MRACVCIDMNLYMILKRERERERERDGRRMEILCAACIWRVKGV